jgi:hypothetical protein
MSNITKHTEEFNRLCCALETNIKDYKQTPRWNSQHRIRDVIIGTEEALYNAKILKCCLILFQDYSFIRISSRIMHKLFLKQLK